MSTPLKILHFADAHIDMANYGRLDPETGLPVRVMDFLKSLEQIINTAIEEKVDLVIFAGDAYKDRNPQPTFQREWGKHIMRLSQAGIPTVLLVGNHDVARASNRAHTLEEYRTLDVPNVFVADKIELLGPEMLGVPVQVLAIPWVSRSALMTRQETAGMSVGEVFTEIESRIETAVQTLLERTNPDLPLIMTAHASVEGAVFGSERQVMLGHEIVLSQGLVRDKRLDYVALGHIHKHQDLNKGQQPPVVYPGSIERIDFGEAREQKGFVMASVAKGHTTWRFEKLETRPFRDYRPDTPTADTFMEDVMRQLPEPHEVADAICRVQLTYPRDWEPLVDETAIARRFDLAMSYQLQKHRLAAKRARLGDTVAVEEMSQLDLLEIYWQTTDLGDEEAAVMQELAKDIFASLHEEEEVEE